MRRIGIQEYPSPLGQPLVREAVVDIVGRQQAQGAVTVVMIIPTEERAAEVTAVLDTAEPIRKLRPVLHGFELSLRVRVVRGGVGP